MMKILIEDWLNQKQAAKLAGVTRLTMKMWGEKEEVRTMKLGDKLFYYKPDVEVKVKKG